MTVFAKNTTYGLETRVKEFQDYLNVELPQYWAKESDGTQHPEEIYIYGLVRKLLRDDSVYPEVYKGTGVKQKEYKELFIDDKVAASVGFLVLDRNPFQNHQANVDIIFTLRIDKIYPDSTTRDIEKALLEAEKVVERSTWVSNVLDIKEGIEDVFSDFETEPIKHRDMHPWYVFSLNVDLFYPDNSCQ
jgi:hypothetical protein